MTFIENIHHENGPPPAQPRRRAAIVAIVSNPFAGAFIDNWEYAMDDLKPLGLRMTDMLIEVMGGVQSVDGYGKAAMAGETGEL